MYINVCVCVCVCVDIYVHHMHRICTSCFGRLQQPKCFHTSVRFFDHFVLTPRRRKLLSMQKMSRETGNEESQGNFLLEEGKAEKSLRRGKTNQIQVARVCTQHHHCPRTRFLKANSINQPLKLLNRAQAATIIE